MGVLRDVDLIHSQMVEESLSKLRIVHKSGFTLMSLQHFFCQTIQLPSVCLLALDHTQRLSQHLLFREVTQVFPRHIHIADAEGTNRLCHNNSQIAFR